MDFIERGEIYSLEIFSFFFLSLFFSILRTSSSTERNNIERERDDSFADFEARREREREKK